MRLKTMDGPLSVHNGNNEVVNSPKRINTIQNSNVTTTIYHSTTSHFTNNSHLTFGLSNNVTNDVITESQTSDLNILSNVIQDKVQWCNPPRLEVSNREITKNCHNINNTLAATLGRHARRRRAATASSSCSESSPDDSLFDFEDAEQSCSSADTSPQEEDRPFDISDSESSEDGNLSHAEDLPQRRGIVNPNYPGFQHLAHTLASDAETDDEFDAPTSQLTFEANNNNDVEGTDYTIDSVNRLDSVENIQKVFYDKPALNIEQDDRNGLDTDSTSGNSNNSDEDTEIRVPFNINVDNKEVFEDIVGDFSGEIEAASVSGTSKGVQDLGDPYQLIELETALFEVTSTGKQVSKDPYQLPKLETAVVKELEEAVEELMILNEMRPSATKYNIKPNIEEPFDKLSPTKQISVHQILEDYTLINNTDEMVIPQENLPFSVKIDDPIRMKIGDAFLSNGSEDIKAPLPKETSLLSSKLKFEHSTRMEEDVVMEKSELVRRDSNREQQEFDCNIKRMRSDIEEEIFHKENLDKDYMEEDQDVAVSTRKEEIDIFVKRRRDYNQQIGSLITFPRRENGPRSRQTINRRSLPMAREKKRNFDALGGFDVYNIETAMPKIDLEAIECHLTAAREAERRIIVQHENEQLC